MAIKRTPSDEYVDRGMPRGEEVQRAPRHLNKAAVGKGSRVPTVNTPSLEWEASIGAWTRISTLLEGTDAMRAVGRTYLPQHEYESDVAYEERLSRSTLRNYVRKTLETLVGKAFKERPALIKPTPQFEDFAYDVDGAGTAMHVMAERWFTEAVSKRKAYLLVDFPQVPETNEDGSPRTLADDMRDRTSPFWTVYKAEDVISLRYAKVGSRQVIVHARLRECSVEENGWEDRLVHRVRVLTPGKFELWRLKEVKNGKEEWFKEDEGPMSIDVVPLIPFETDPERPPLDDLAHLNIEHWQSSADQRVGLTVARFPLLAVSGVSDSEGLADPSVVIGPKRWLGTQDPSGKIYYVEHTGAALKTGADDLEHLEQEMASYGAQFLRQRPGSETATARAMDGSEAISPLKAWGLAFKDALEQALVMTARWWGLEEDAAPAVQFEVEDDVELGDASALDALDKARTRRDISRTTYLNELQRRKVLSKEFDAETDQEELDAEPPPPGTGLDGMGKGLSGVPSPPRKTPAG